jgi:hypothetical protein
LPLWVRVGALVTVNLFVYMGNMYSVSFFISLDIIMCSQTLNFIIF